jgi:hypothetical protein
VCLLSARNRPFEKVIAQIIKLIENHNAVEFSSCAFNDYCMTLCIHLEHYVPYIYTQNGLAKSLIKRVKLIVRPLLQNCNLPTSCWEHTILHAAYLIQVRPTTYYETSPF